jgi:translation initiation factor 2 alpha subunit (eIF-2alpha)
MFFPVIGQRVTFQVVERASTGFVVRLLEFGREAFIPFTEARGNLVRGQSDVGMILKMDVECGFVDVTQKGVVRQDEILSNV